MSSPVLALVNISKLQVVFTPPLTHTYLGSVGLFHTLPLHSKTDRLTHITITPISQFPLPLVPAYIT